MLYTAKLQSKVSPMKTRQHRNELHPLWSIAHKATYCTSMEGTGILCLYKAQHFILRSFTAPIQHTREPGSCFPNIVIS